MDNMPFEFMNQCEYCARPTFNDHYCSDFCRVCSEQHEREQKFASRIVACMGLLGVGVLVAAIVIGCLR